MDYVLGVDGGNTKTIALVGRLDGAIVGVGRAGCSDIYSNPSPEVPLAEAEAAIESALEMACIAAEELAAGAFSMAGADWSEDYALIQAAMEERGYGRRVLVANDGVGALRAGTPDGTGVVVVCGTGTATAARSPEGRTWHSSWWQEVQGAHQLADKALWAVYRAALGIDLPTSLTAAVLSYFAMESVEEVLHLFTARQGCRPSSFRGLARVLLDEAERGDAAARKIVVEHGAALGDYALAAARQVGIEGTAFTLALSGGVLRHPSPLMREAIIERVRTTSPQVRPVISRFEPAAGAFLLALEAAGVAVSDDLIARMVPTLPAAELFAT